MSTSQPSKLLIPAFYIDNIHYPNYNFNIGRREPTLTKDEERFMDTKLVIAIITITCALIFYTLGVFAERKSKILNRNHVFIFLLGLIFDTIGTSYMTLIARDNSPVVKSGLVLNLHGITGTLAILLMLFHACWAIWVLYKNDLAKKKFFHKFSIVVWSIWLIPYFAGMFMGMIK